MDKWSQLKYISQLHLDQLIKRPAGFTSRCPVCLDSKKSKKKRRFHILTEKSADNVLCYCFNCSLSVTLKTLIKMINPMVYEEYCAEEKQEYIKKLKEGRIGQRKVDAPIFKYDDDLKLFELSPQFFIPVTESPAHLSYCEGRKINTSDVFVSTARKKEYSGMLIFPFRYNEKYVHGFMGRSIVEKRFHIFSPSDSFKVYNFFNVNKDKTVYCTESIIDSMFVDNCIAMVGADLSRKVRDELKELVFIPDFDKTGLEKSFKFVEAGEKIFIWPKEWQKYKDFNDLVLDTNITKEELMKIVNKNVFSGTRAKIMLQFLSHNHRF